ncbi:hypothetical protein TELCIR_11808, partial [Teladorsagia circumcincta]
MLPLKNRPKEPYTHQGSIGIHMIFVHREIDVFIHKLFFRFGLIVHKFRFEFLVASLLCTAFCGYGLRWIEELTTKDPQFVFSPNNAPWRYEYA